MNSSRHIVSISKSLSPIAGTSYAHSRRETKRQNDKQLENGKQKSSRKSSPLKKIESVIRNRSQFQPISAKISSPSRLVNLPPSSLEKSPLPTIFSSLRFSFVFFRHQIMALNMLHKRLSISVYPYQTIPTYDQRGLIISAEWSSFPFKKQVFASYCRETKMESRSEKDGMKLKKPTSQSAKYYRTDE